MAKKPPQSSVLIRYPQLRGYILKSHELKGILEARFHVAVDTEQQGTERFALLLDGSEIYSEPADTEARLNVSRCIDTLREHNVCEQTTAAQSPVLSTHHDDENDPEHRQWLNNVCSGE